MEGRPFGAYAVYDAKRWWWLWLLPLTRLIAVPLTGERVLFALRDAVPAVLLTAYSLLKWRRCRYTVSESDSGKFHNVSVRQGLLVRHALHICADDAASVEVERTPLLWLLRGRRIRISTAGLRRRADAVLYLTASRTKRLFALDTHTTRRFRTHWRHVAVMALTGSNAAVGLITAAPLLRQAGRALGEGFPQNVTDAVNGLLWQGLPPLLQTAGNLVLLGWGVSALRTFLRYVGFYAQREEEHLHLVSGLFTRRDVLIDCEKITALELRQTLTMRMLGLSSAVITAAGYGRDVGTRPILVPAARRRALADCLNRLLPEYPTHVPLLFAVSRWRYVWAPLLFMSVGVGLSLFGGLWRILTAAWVALGGWWLLVRLLGYTQAGFGITPTAVALCYPRGLSLCRVYLPREVTDCITLSQSPFQRLKGTCTVQVRCFGEKRRRHRVWGLPYERVRELIK